MMGLLKSSIIQSLGVWVAVSCLTGLLIFLIIKIFDAIFSNQSSTDRYHKSIIALLFFFLLNSAGTFYFQDISIHKNQTPDITEVSKANQEFNADNLIMEIPKNESLTNSQADHIFNMEFLFKSLGIFWLIGALVFTIKMMGGYFYTRTLIISSQRSIPENWAYFITQQLEKLKISRNVKVFESNRINSAFTFGFIKPIIVLPLGFFTTIPPEQIEAVLLHELYHIKHKDYVVNMLTMTFEVIFFYHPVMWWLAKNIRIERENRCDDQVTQIMDKKVYAHALLNMESYRQSLNYAIPFSNKQSNLKMRIMRIFEQKPKQNIGLKPFLSLLMLVVFLMSFTFYKLEEPKVELKPESENQLKDDLKGTENLENSDEDILFKTEDSKLDIVIEMTKSSLIAKSNNKNVSLFLDENLQSLNKEIPFGGQDIVAMYKNDEGSSYHFFTKQYFESLDRNEWEQQNKNRSIYIFDASDESSFLIRLPEPFNSKNSKVNTNKTENNIQNPAQSINSINKVEKKSADLSEIKIHGPLKLQFKDKTYQNGDTNNLEVLKKLVKKFSADENSEVKIKIDGKLIDEETDVEKALGNREIKNIRIVMPTKDAEIGVIEIITDDVKEMLIEEVPADENKTSGIKEVAEKENNISIELYFESDKLNYSGEVKFNAEKENVLDALGFFDDDPLFVLNDKIVGSKFQISDIKLNDIERINVLKDKKATDKYGEKAKNGVVEIYLKKE